MARSIDYYVKDRGRDYRVTADRFHNVHSVKLRSPGAVDTELAFGGQRFREVVELASEKHQTKLTFGDAK
jgi:hypothetical protein